MMKNNIKYGPFADVACVVRMIGPIPWKRTYTTKKLFEQFTDMYCQPDITDPDIRTRAYTSMLMEQRIGDSIYRSDVEAYVKREQTSIDFEDGTVGKGIGLSSRYKNYTVAIICLNTTDHPEKVEPVKSYLRAVKAYGVVSNAITHLIDEVRTICADDKEGDN